MENENVGRRQMKKRTIMIRGTGSCLIETEHEYRMIMRKVDRGHGETGKFVKEIYEHVQQQKREEK